MPKDYMTISQFEGFKSEMQEFKSEMYDFRDEMREFKNEMLEIKDEMFEFKNATSEQYENQNIEHQRQVGAIREDHEHWAKFIVESLRTDIERLERKFGPNDEEHKKFDKRIIRLEAKLI